jgi:hypothetical protein
LATEPVAAVGVLDSRWFLIAFVEFELLLGVCLVSGLFPVASWWVALATFSTFAVAAAGKAIAGASSCGCFGRLPTSPWLSFSIDVAAVAGLICLGRPKLEHSAALALSAAGDSPWASGPLGPRLFPTYVLAVWIVAAVPIGILAARGPERAPFATIGHRVGDVVIVEPERAVGQPFELGRYMDIGDQIAHGRWLFVLYRAGCPDCHSLISHLRGTGFRREANVQVALVGVPPDVAESTPSPADVRWGALTAEVGWFVTTPSVFWVVNNRVMVASTGIDGILEEFASTGS